MEILPILSSLRRNRTAVLLIGLQIALTLAIVCNSMSVIQQRLRQLDRPSGIDEANIFTLQSEWLGQPVDLTARIEEDLAAMRSVPGVIDAYATNSLPLFGSGQGAPLGVKPGRFLAGADEYFADQHALATLGMKLIGGRWFSAEDVKALGYHEDPAPAVIVVTRGLAQRLFPGTEALGQVVYVQSTTPSRIVGIVERAQTSWAASHSGRSGAENSMFLPYQQINDKLLYVVRTRPGQLAAVMQAVQAKLFSITQQRLIENVQPFSQTRLSAYRQVRWSIVPLSVLCVLLFTVTACGIVGLTTYWVTQRRRYIGMRRALGARRFDILRYFHTENLLIAGVGCIFGIALGLAGNVWVAFSMEVARMSVSYICTVALIVLALCQAAVLWPALRAASVPPAIATRGL